jgi:hypothetical protein
VHDTLLSRETAALDGRHASTDTLLASAREGFLSAGRGFVVTFDDEGKVRYATIELIFYSWRRVLTGGEPEVIGNTRVTESGFRTRSESWCQ